MLVAAVVSVVSLRSSRAGGQPVGTWSSSAMVSHASVSRGSRITIDLTVTAPITQVALVDLEVYGPLGAKVFQRAWEGASLTSGTSSTFRTTWRAPGNEPAGTHIVKIGVFSPGWGTLLHWNNGAATFTVGAGSTTTTATTATTTTTVPPTSTTAASTTTTTTTQPAPSGLPARPAGFPATMQLGISDRPGGAVAARAMAPFGFRYQYLAGGVNTGWGWATGEPRAARASPALRQGEPTRRG